MPFPRLTAPRRVWVLRRLRSSEQLYFPSADFREKKKSALEIRCGAIYYYGHQYSAFRNRFGSGCVPLYTCVRALCACVYVCVSVCLGMERGGEKGEK